MTAHDTRARQVRRRRLPELTRTGQVVVGTVVLAVLVVVEGDLGDHGGPVPHGDHWHCPVCFERLPPDGRCDECGWTPRIPVSPVVEGEKR